MAYVKQNYQPGDVLTAEQVNKIQDTIIKNEGNIDGHIESKNNPHGVTPAQIGAAPGGYGLGVYGATLPAVLDVDSATNIGWYYINASSANNPIGVGGVLRVESVNGNAVVQTLFSGSYSTKYTALLQRDRLQGVWQEWEWVNPPMVLATEYRTTERWNGKAVYTKLIDFGALPSNTSKAVGIGTTIDELVSLEMYSVRASNSVTVKVPIIGADNSRKATVYSDKNRVVVVTFEDMSDYTTSKVLLKYTKA